ncbi:aldolase [Aspergillus ellipticus CBS 707.79]|uniref:2-isopropylmalate synthase n=1 Tax=Aspergillus ellipticus CBS 707.79 TaxID=1448320 RepID=A0A319DIE5_9EURO|nr:aldolase [Aspergillus ellipticus CBS 707.79]
MNKPRLRNPSTKYPPAPHIANPTRQWPNKTPQSAPRWLSTDLRDGNQSLSKPLTTPQKQTYFTLLTQLGYKEIEACYPSASSTEYAFARHLITTPDLVPSDVWLQFMSPCREDLIRRTIDAAAGAKRAIIHIYVAVSAIFMDGVLGMTEDEVLALAVKSTALVRSLTIDSPDPQARKTKWALQFTPETFQDCDIHFAVRICDAVKTAWGWSEEKIIFNLPATVEMSTPNVFADQVEVFCNAIAGRGDVCVSVHPHNDRGCAVAAAEMALLAGADRVEGCLFGNGERTGNVDLVTLALNLYSRGVDPRVWFDDLRGVSDMVMGLTGVGVHVRQPYVGELAFVTFAGAHQDAVPYLPLDPAGLGRGEEEIVRITAQSGKAGCAWVLKKRLGLELPRALGAWFAGVVTGLADREGREISGEEVVGLFRREVMGGSFRGVESVVVGDGVSVRAQVGEWEKWVEGKGGDLTTAVGELLRQGGVNAQVEEVSVQTLDGRLAAYVAVRHDGAVRWGVGMAVKADDAIAAALRSVLGRMQSKDSWV